MCVVVFVSFRWLWHACISVCVCVCLCLCVLCVLCVLFVLCVCVCVYFDSNLGRGERVRGLLLREGLVIQM